MIARLLRYAACLLLAVAMLASTSGMAHHAMAGHGDVSKAPAILEMHHAGAMAHGDHERPNDQDHDGSPLSCCMSMAGACSVWADLGAAYTILEPVPAMMRLTPLPEHRRTGVTPEQHPRPPRI